MSDHGEAVRRPARASLSPRNRKRWMIAGGVAAGWVALLAVTGSLTGATILLIAIVGLGVTAVLGLRALGVTREHPWIRRMAERPWRDGQEVLRLALRHLSEVFVVTPSGTLLAPNIVELRMHPDDLQSLGERMEPALVMASATEVYEEQVAEHGARFARPAPVEVRMIADPSVPPGRYRLRQGQPVNAGVPSYPEPQAYAIPEPAYAGAPAGPVSLAGPTGTPPYRGIVGDDEMMDRPHQDRPHQDRPDQDRPYLPRQDRPDQDRPDLPQPDRDLTQGYGLPTVMERRNQVLPVLRLVTGDLVAETRASGARAGRGSVELALPEVQTVSREHARFTFSDGQWWIANLGMNGLTVNGQPVAGEHPVGTGDVIRWGMRPDALASRVEIG
ncbi:MAG: FHA domain-containing protein [Streptosporangiaceae bacterium]